MNLQNWFLIANIFICLIVSAFLFALKIKKMQPSLLSVIFLLLPMTTLIISLYTVWSSADFIISTSRLQFISPILLAIPFAIISFCKQISLLYRFLLSITLSAISIFAFNLPIDIIPQAPLWLNQTLAIFLWSIVTISMRILNKYDSFVAAEGFSICIGIIILYFIGGLPFALAFYATGFAALLLSFLLYNWHPARITMPNSTADLIGFILGGLLISSSTESAFSPVLIFFLLFFAETIFAIIQKLTFLPQYTDVSNNTSFAHAINSGMPFPAVIGHFIRINALLVIFGCFQAYSPNAYSLILITTLITAWQMYRLINWQQPTSSLKELNKEIFTEIKTSVSKVKQQINSTDKQN